MSSELTPVPDDNLIVRASLADMHANLRSVVGQIDEMITEQHASNILTMWRIGELMHEIDTNPANYLTEEQQSQHLSPSALLASFFNKTHNPEQFEISRNFFEQYPTKDDITRLIHARCPARPNWRLTASHVQLLLSVPDPDQRKVIESRCVKEAYTTRALAVELSELRGEPKKAEKRLTAPKGLKQRVYDMLEHQRKFIARSEKLWLADDGLYDAIMNASPSQLNETIRGYLAEIDENFEKLQAAVQDHRAMIRRVDELLEKIDAESADAATDDGSTPAPHASSGLTR